LRYIDSPTKEHAVDAKTLKDAKADLERLMDEAVENHEPVIITRDGKPPVVLMSLADWNSQQETDYLLRNPENRRRLRRSIRDADKGKFAKVMRFAELDRIAKKKSRSPSRPTAGATSPSGSRPTERSSIGSCVSSRSAVAIPSKVR
jgi:antitoxin YefM